MKITRQKFDKLLGLRLVCGILIASAAIRAHAADYPTKVLGDKPVVYWRLNDKATVPAADLAKNSGSLGTRADGYYTGAASHPVTGALAASTDGAAAFDKTAGTAMAVPFLPEINPSTAFTAEVWLNPSEEFAAGSGTLTCALASGQFAAPRSGWLIYQSETGWNFRMYNQNGANTTLNITGGPAPVANTWHHIVVVYDGTKASLYVNGALSASGTPSGGYVPSAGGQLYVAARSDASFWWMGSADELAVYNKALSAGDIAAHYQNGTNSSPATTYDKLVLASTPVAYYRLDEPAYTAPASFPAAINSGSLGAAYNASFYAGLDAKAEGPRPTAQSGFEADNTAAGLNGLAGYVGSPFTLNDLAAFSAMGWIKRGATHSSRGGYFGQNDLLEIGDADNGANIEVYINAYGTNIKFPYPFPNDQWGFLAVIGDGTKLTVYTNATPAGSIVRAVETFGSSAYNFNIGGGGIFNAAGDYFLGSVDEVAVFDKALTPAQLQDIYLAGDIVPTIITQPTAPRREIHSGNVVTLNATAAGTPPLTYQWHAIIGGKDSAISGATSAQLVFSSITPAEAGDYYVVVSNAYGSVSSAPVTIPVLPADTVPPTITGARATESFKKIWITFTDPLDPVSAETTSNYQIPGLTVSGAVLSAPAGTDGDNVVVLTTSTQTPGQTYTITVNGVKDQTALRNPIAPNTTIQVQAWILSVGNLKFEHYDNLSGAADTDIDNALKDPRVIAGTPTTAGYIAGRFDTRTIFADDTHENYFARISGWITPTATGDYDFFLRSDDAGRLYLSKGESIPDPAVDVPICTEPDCCGPFYEPSAGDPATTAAPIHLEAGHRYGVLAYLKEGGGGDYLMVAWRNVTDTTPAADLPTIPGQFLSAYVDPNVDLAFATQPADQLATLPKPVTAVLTNDFSAGGGSFTVLNTDPPPPGPWAYKSATGEWVADGSTGDCGGPFNSRLISPTYTVPQAGSVTLTFKHRYSFENGFFDGGQVLVSTNGGDFKDVTADAFTANGYSQDAIVGNGVLKGKPAFNNESEGYGTSAFITSTVVLGSFQASDKIAFQFLGAWDDCSTGVNPNWVITDLHTDVPLVQDTSSTQVALSAAASASRQGAPVAVAYQWQRDDGAGFQDIPSATASSYRFYPNVADFSATFRVLAKVPGKALPSNSVKLLNGTDAPPVITIALTDGAAAVTYTGKLQSSVKASGPYADVPNAQSPYSVPAPGGAVFFRSVK